MAVLEISHITHTLSLISTLFIITLLFIQSSSLVYKDGHHYILNDIYTHAWMALRYSARYGLASAEGPSIISFMSYSISYGIIIDMDTYD